MIEFIASVPFSSVRRNGAGTSTYTIYDEAGHWLGEYDDAGNRVQQAVWLDDLPVGLVANNLLHYVEPDHLGTPRVVIDRTRNVAVWTWDLKGEAFGSSSPNQNPDGDANLFVFNLRFPGQRYDTATGMNYNYFRDYDSGSGRYVESDPIGLNGGISTYAYVAGNPILFFDPLGLREGSPSNLRRRQAIANWALSQNGRPDWDYYNNHSPQYPGGNGQGSWKCSAFVCDAVKGAGANGKVDVPGRPAPQCPTAAEWAKGNVEDWRHLGPYEERFPGDIVAERNVGPNSTGHTAIVVPGPNGGVSTIGAHESTVGPVGNDNFSSGATVLRFTGD